MKYSTLVFQVGDENVLQVGIILGGGEESPKTIAPGPGPSTNPNSNSAKALTFFSSPIVGASLILIRDQNVLVYVYHLHLHV